jgi:hypothetical protein
MDLALGYLRQSLEQGRRRGTKKNIRLSVTFQNLTLIGDQHGNSKSPVHSRFVTERLTVSSVDRTDKRERRALGHRSRGPLTKGVAFPVFLEEIEASPL